MKLCKKSTSVFMAVLCLASLGITGCKGSNGGGVTKQEETNWKGGPMPADFKPNVAGGGGGAKSGAPAPPPGPAGAAPK